MAAWLDLRFELVTSTEQIDELRRVLAYPKLRPLIDPGQARDFVENVEALADVTAALPALDVSPDPDDNVILAAAVAGRVDAVVSGDRSGMLAVGAVEGIPIITARDALQRLGLKND